MGPIHDDALVQQRFIVCSLIRTRGLMTASFSASSPSRVETVAPFGVRGVVVVVFLFRTLSHRLMERHATTTYFTITLPTVHVPEAGSFVPPPELDGDRAAAPKLDSNIIRPAPGPRTPLDLNLLRKKVEAKGGWREASWDFNQRMVNQVLIFQNPTY